MNLRPAPEKYEEVRPKQAHHKNVSVLKKPCKKFQKNKSSAKKTAIYCFFNTIRDIKSPPTTIQTTNYLHPNVIIPQAVEDRHREE